jgi:hypothetical protein
MTSWIMGTKKREKPIKVPQGNRTLFYVLQHEVFDVKCNCALGTYQIEQDLTGNHVEVKLTLLSTTRKLLFA